MKNKILILFLSIFTFIGGITLNAKTNEQFFYAVESIYNIINI